MFTLRGYRTVEPFREMAKLTREMNRLLLEPSEQQAHSGVYPAVNVYDRDETLMLRAEIPGIDPNSLDIQATATSLTIEGEHPEGEGTSDHSYHRAERNRGKFNRTLSLPLAIDPDKVHASYKHGVLELMLPKAESARARKIAIR